MTRRLTRSQRLIHGLVYLAFIITGLSGLFLPSETILNILPGGFRVAWVAPLVLGGSFCAFAVIRDKPWYELLGLPLLCSGAAMYFVGLGAKISGGSSNVSGTIVVLSLLTALALLLLDRLLEVLYLFQAREIRKGR